MTDYVRPLKLENPSDGGTGFDMYPTEMNPLQDSLVVKGIAFKYNDINIELGSNNDLILTDLHHTVSFPLHQIAENVVTADSNYTASRENIILCDAGSGAFTVTLPTVVDNVNKVYSIKKIDNTSNIVTVDTNSSETIDGSLTWNLKKYDTLKIVSNGSGWFVI